MRVKKDMQIAGILFLCLILQAGCGRTERVKTIVLEDPIKAQETEDERADDYQVKKIYTWEYAAPTPQSASVLECDEHKIRLASVAEDGSGVQFDRLDYRYGFYEAYGKADRERLAIYDRASAEEKQFMINALSPDGRFLLWLEEEPADPTVKMYMNNLETGEDELLLDGETLKCSEEEYFPLTAWSEDGKYLAYCFFPRSWDTYNRDGKVPVNIFSIDKNKIINQYYYVPGEMLDLDNVKLYLDVADGKALTVLTAGLFAKKDNVVKLEICSFGIEEKPGEEQWINRSTGMMESGAAVYPDAETGEVYIGKEFGRIYRIEAETGNYGENALIEQGYVDLENTEENSQETQTVQFLVLDQGNTVISTEKAETGHDICIYQKKGENWERRILYHYNAGALYFLQYDGKNHRLLAISSSVYIYGVNQTAIILEF